MKDVGGKPSPNFAKISSICPILPALIEILLKWKAFGIAGRTVTSCGRPVYGYQRNVQ
jgi:hypothetical protein